MNTLRSISMALILGAATVGCAGQNVEAPRSMMSISKVVEVRIEGETLHESVLAQIKSQVEQRLRARGFEIGGSLENWRLDIDVLEIDTTKLKNQRRLVLELRVRAVGPRGEEYWKYNFTEVTKRVTAEGGTLLGTHLPLVADDIVARVP